MSNYVYVIVNKKNLKLYFGSHSWSGEGLDPNYYGSGKIIKQAVNKYGRDNFIIQPIKFYNTVEECRQAEEELLTKYDIANNPRCYNVKNAAVGWTSEDITGENNPWYGKHHTDKTRNKMSKAKNDKKIPIVAIQLSTGRVKLFKSLTECSRVLGLAIPGIQCCVKGKSKSYRGYTFKYIEQLESGIYEGITDLTLEPSKASPTPIVAIHKATGRVRMFSSQGECSRVLGVHLGNINKCLKGIRNHTGGYIIKHLKRCSGDYKITKRKAKETEKIKLTTERKATTERKGSTPIVAIDKNGSVKIFESQHECSRVLGIHQGNINNCLTGRCKSAGGYTFKKINRDKRVFKVSPRSKADI